MHRHALRCFVAVFLVCSCDSAESHDKKAVAKPGEAPVEDKEKERPEKEETKAADQKKAATKADDAKNAGQEKADEEKESEEEALADLPAPTGDKPSAGPLRFDPVEGPGGKLPYEKEADPEAEEEVAASASWEFGWTKDSKGFAWCRYDASDEGGECWFEQAGGKEKTFTPEKWHKFEKKNGPLHRGQMSWPYGDITITWERKEHEVIVGGRAAKTGGKPDVFKWEFDPDTYFETEGDVGLGFVSISPDAKQMAVLGVAILGFVDEQRSIEKIATAEFAAKVYSAHGFQGLKANKFEEAAAWFARASTVDEHWKYPYNQACASARGKLDGTQAALQEAITRGGSQVKKKAKRDKDLTNVQAEDWFKALVG